MHPQSGAFEIHHTAQDAFLAIKSMQVRSVIGRQYVQLVLLIEEMFIKYKNTSEQHIALGGSVQYLVRRSIAPIYLDTLLKGQENWKEAVFY